MASPRHVSLEDAVAWFPTMLAPPLPKTGAPASPSTHSPSPGALPLTAAEQKAMAEGAASPVLGGSYSPEPEGFPPVVSSAAYIVQKAVGSGVSGTAFLVEKVGDRRKYIAKITDLSNMNDRKKGYARMEIQCLAQCSHFSIIQHVMHMVSADGSKILLIMEFADAGDLSRQIKHRAKDLSYFREHEVAFLFLQLVLAVNYIHEKRMLHRDIKSANVFLMQAGITKIGDFGFSQLYEGTVSGDVAGTFCGTPYYLAPELWRRQRYSSKADVWSLGVVLYEMLALKRPFVAGSMLGLMDRVMGGEYEPLPATYSEGMHDLVKKMLCFDPNGRPTTQQLLAHPYLIATMTQFEGTVRRVMSPADQARILSDLADGRQAAAAATAVEWGVGDVQMCVQHRGVLQRYGSTGWKQRFLVLGGGELTISLVEQSVGDTKMVPVKAILHVLPVQPDDAQGRPFCFCIGVTNGQRHLFQAASDDDMRQWMARLMAAVGEG